MARKGSANNPIMLRAASDERGREAAELCVKHGWHYIIEVGAAVDDFTDLEQALHPPEPLRAERTPGRNDPCPCGSGEKYKRCHMGKGT